MNISSTSDYTFNLSYNSELECVTMEISGKLSGSAFRENTMKMYAFMRKTNSSKIFVDCRKMKIINVKDRRWLENEFLPMATSEGFKVVSFVKPEDYFAQLSIELVMYKFPENTLRGAWFKESEEAINWLKKTSVS